MPPLQTLNINVCVRNLFEINPETFPEVEHKHASEPVLPELWNQYMAPRSGRAEYLIEFWSTGENPSVLFIRVHVVAE